MLFYCCCGSRLCYFISSILMVLYIHMGCFARFDTICTISKSGKLPRRSVTFKKLQAIKSCSFTKSNTTPWMFFMLFKLYRWYQIAKRITIQHEKAIVICSSKLILICITLVDFSILLMQRNCEIIISERFSFCFNFDAFIEKEIMAPFCCFYFKLLVL